MQLKDITSAIALIICVVGGSSAAAQSPALRTLYIFEGPPDASYPHSSLVIGKGDVLYGTTSYGGTAICGTPGTDGCGTVFELTPNSPAPGSWTETVLHDFGFGSDGAFVLAPLLLSRDGVLYGTTVYGGSGSCNPQFEGFHGCGTVFSLTPPSSGSGWTENILYSFVGGSDGAYPSGGLAIDRNGVLYGTTEAGGSGSCVQVSGTGCGTVFSLMPGKTGAWTEAVLYSFAGSPVDGSVPEAGVVIGKNGTLYGTTTTDGMFKLGNVYSVVPPPSSGGAWTEVVIHDFAGYPDDGGLPAAPLLVGTDGTLYGTTVVGGRANEGIVYSLAQLSSDENAWTETLLHTFTGPPNGAAPAAPLVMGNGGLLYGSTTSGGTSLCQASGYCGSVFSLTPPASGDGPWTETVLHSFYGKDGDTPESGVVIDADGILYGTTEPPGIGRILYGTVYSIKP